MSDSSIPPMVFAWDGEAMIPKKPGLADRHYVVGQDYTLMPWEERSSNSHRHYFALVNEAWKSLPDAAAVQFPSSDHLRKFALIKTGFRDERSIAAASKAEALRLAAFIRPFDEYAIVTVVGTMVSVYTAKSQSSRAMGKEQFQASKEAVLDYLAAMIDVTPAELKAQAGAAA